MLDPAGTTPRKNKPPRIPAEPDDVIATAPAAKFVPQKFIRPVLLPHYQHILADYTDTQQYTRQWRIINTEAGKKSREYTQPRGFNRE